MNKNKYPKITIITVVYNNVNTIVDALESLHSQSYKLFEHIIASHIMQHLENNNILYDLQHGFRRSRSCESQLLSLIHDMN